MSTYRIPELRIAIFGATSDIAVALARRYALCGAKLVLVARDPTGLDTVAADLKVRGAMQVICQEADFSELARLAVIARTAWEAVAGLDIAVVAYGSLPDQSIAQTSANEATAALELNFVSPAVLIGELAPLFEQRRSGVIVAITSVAGDRGRKSNYIYGAAKGGLQRFLEGLRHRLASCGVSVVDVRPGFVASKMTAHLPQSGPLWAAPDKVAEDIMRAIDRRRAVLYTPWFWSAILAIVRALPRSIFHRTSL